MKIDTSLRRLTLLAIILLTFLMSTHAAGSNELNVLLITVDTLRADHLGSYGYRSETQPESNSSPEMDQLAKEGTLFENAIAQCGSTWPSLASIHSSLYPHDHGGEA